MDRRFVQQQHERAVVQDFLAWLNARRGTQFKVIEEPTQPDAIIRSARVTRWVEVTDAFWTDAWAQDLYSGATPGEVYRPVGPGPYAEMDGSLATHFVQVLVKKLKKTSYRQSLEKYGAGYLLIPIHHPLFARRTVWEMKDLWRAKQPVENLGCFKEIYFSFQTIKGPVFRRWRVQ